MYDSISVKIWFSRFKFDHKILRTTELDLRLGYITVTKYIASLNH